jgi:SAM-dependent methyltransferase
MTRPLAFGVAAGLLLLTAAALRVGGGNGDPPRTSDAAASAEDVVPPVRDDQRDLFKPEDLPLLEGPDRALWQQPEQVMDALQIAYGSVVADIGAGAGWFTIRLARRVCPELPCSQGKVYAQDLQREMVIAIRRRVARENLSDVVEVIQGTEQSLNLPPLPFDAILAVDVYPEVRDRVGFLRSLSAALKPTGRIGIINYKPGGAGPGPLPEDRVESSTVINEAAAVGLRVVETMELRYQYLIVLGHPRTS